MKYCYLKKTMYVLTICLRFSTRLIPIIPKKDPKPSWEQRKTKGGSIWLACLQAWCWRLTVNNAQETATLKTLDPRSKAAIPTSPSSDHWVADGFMYIGLASRAPSKRMIGIDTAETWSISSSTFKHFNSYIRLTLDYRRREHYVSPSPSQRTPLHSSPDHSRPIFCIWSPGERPTWCFSWACPNPIVGEELLR